MWIKNTNINFTGKPYQHAIVENFLTQEKLQEIIDALGDEIYYDKKSDLFTFKQTNDLRHSKNTTIQELHKEFGTLIKKLQEATGKKLGTHIDMFGSLYQDTDHLLPHDDRLEKRKIAYILYLNTLETKQGGALALYNTQNNKPTTIAKTIQPKENMLVLFVVSNKSYHEVQEVINTDRMTITGWFHAN